MVFSARRRPVVTTAAALISALSLAACASTEASTDGSGSGSDEAKEVTLSLVAYSTPQAAFEKIIAAFQETDAGANVKFEQSYGASGDQSRAVEAGLPADFVMFSLETDMTRLVDAGMVDAGWSAGEDKGILTESVVALVTREGNPKGVRSWADLTRKDVEVITPNPFSSGGARWNIMAGYGAQIEGGKTPAEAEQYLADLLGNVPVQDESARAALQTFSGGKGDVLISYENEAIFAQQNGEAIDYVVPPDTLLIENPAAVTSEAKDGAEEFLDFVASAEAQEIYAGFGFRPIEGVEGVELPEVEGVNDPADPFPAPEQLFTIDEDFDGWAAASEKFFADGEDGGPLGIIPQLIEDSGADAQE
jgi:sulfate/thiosulfate-binding protein